VRFGKEVGAVAVCADVGRPSHSRQAAARGARTYLASMFVIPSEHERETATLRAAAAEHGMTVAFANYGGPSGGLAAAGGSAIWSDRGALLGRLGPIGAGVAIAIEERGGWSVRTVMLSEGGARASGRRA
jgi:predicted amidohydrolase